MPGKPSFKGKLLFQEMVIFGLVQFLGLWCAIRLFCRADFVEIKTVTSLWEFLLAFGLATLLIIFFLKLIKGKIFFKSLFLIVIFLGAQIIFSIFFPAPVSVLLAIALIVILKFVLPRVWFHNLAIIIGVSGIGAAFGLSLPISAVLMILFFLSVYDYVAVYTTTHMVAMFKGLVERGVVMALIFPLKLRDWKADLSKVAPGNEYLFLGTGDLVLPLVFAVSALSYGLESAIFTIAGSLVGLVILHVLFTTQSKKMPMPAMPPLALFSVLGFLISILIK